MGTAICGMSRHHYLLAYSTSTTSRKLDKCGVVRSVGLKEARVGAKRNGANLP